MTESRFEPVIGLEIHVQLNTATKMFCACENRFGAEPNTLTCPLCLGHPGVLPLINQGAVEKAIQIGLALNCRIAPRSVFHRKNYFYPDSPKAYQISQYDEPICLDGHLDVAGARIGITRAHLEEDAAKLVHSGGEAGRTAAEPCDGRRLRRPVRRENGRRRQRHPEDPARGGGPQRRSYGVFDFTLTRSIGRAL